MPLLDADMQRRLLGPLPEICRCGVCGKIPVRTYCRRCDEFTDRCDCPPAKGLSGLDHTAPPCRVYTPGVIEDGASMFLPRGGQG